MLGSIRQHLRRVFAMETRRFTIPSVFALLAKHGKQAQVSRMRSSARCIIFFCCSSFQVLLFQTLTRFFMPIYYIFCSRIDCCCRPVRPRSSRRQFQLTRNILFTLTHAQLQITRSNPRSRSDFTRHQSHTQSQLYPSFMDFVQCLSWTLAGILTLPFPHTHLESRTFDSQTIRLFYTTSTTPRRPGARCQSSRVETHHNSLTFNIITTACLFAPGEGGCVLSLASPLRIHIFYHSPITCS